MSQPRKHFKKSNKDQRKLVKRLDRIANEVVTDGFDAGKVDELGSAKELIVALFRGLAPECENMEDKELILANMELIEAGYIRVFMAIDKTGFYGRCNLRDIKDGSFIEAPWCLLGTYDNPASGEIQ